MKNGLLKSFWILLIFFNLIFFESILLAFMGVSDFFWAIANFDVGCVVLGCAVGIVSLVFLVYYFRHRMRKNSIVEVVEFKCPDDMTPAEVGFLIDGVVDSEDLSAMFVYWANKKYIEIVQGGKDKKKEQKLKKLVEKLPDDARSYEKKLFSAIFGKQKEVDVNTLGDRLQGNSALTNSVRTVETIVSKKYFNTSAIWSRQVFLCIFAFLFYIAVMYFRLEYYVDVIPIVEGCLAVAGTALFVIAADFYLKYYDYRHKNNVKKGRVFSLVFLVIVIAALAGLCVYFFYTDYYQAIFLVCFCALLLLVVFLCKNIEIYKPDGQKKLGQVLGFRNFIQVAEKDRIEMLVNDDPTVFYHVLPYAFVLGVSDKWIKNLDVLKIESVENKRMMNDITFYNLFFLNTHVRFTNLMRFARVGRIAGTVISYGQGRGGISIGRGNGGGSKGGSNFGGIRRR